MRKIIYVLITSALCSACSAENLYENDMINEAQVTQTTRAGAILAAMPKPNQPIPVVVYDFQDQTGQFKANDNFVEYSSAVTKGGLAVLVKSLIDTSDGNFFTVAERGGLNNLLKERQIIRAMRSDYSMPDGSKLPDLSPMLYGGIILEGGIIFYDSNAITGGVAAGYFGISGSTQYRRDIVSVYLRAVEVQTGKVILAVNSSKTVFSYGVSGSLLRYLSVDRLLETEGGYSVNEPGQLAVRQAIETSVYSLIMEGALRDMWSFKDKAAGQQALAEYLKRRDKVTAKPATEDAPSAENAKAMAIEPQTATPSSTNASDTGAKPALAIEAQPDTAKDVSECNSFNAWLHRNFGQSSAPQVISKPAEKKAWNTRSGDSSADSDYPKK